MLLMRLRGYSGKFWIFREAADFVAHNDTRSRGLVNESLDAFSLNVRFFLLYPWANVDFDFDMPFPSFVRVLLLRQLKKFSDKELLEAVGSSRAGIKKKIENHIKKSGEASCIFDVHKLKNSDYVAFAYLLERMRVEPVFSPDDLVSEIFGVLASNDISYDDCAFLRQKPKFILCFALLLHDTKYGLTDDVVGSCRFGFDEIDGDNYLVVAASFDVAVKGASVSMVHTVFETGLILEEVCGESLLSDDRQLLRSNLQQPICLVGDKLELISAVV